MIPMDNIHYSFRAINGYNKPINIVISPREPGKTSMAWMQLVYLPYKKTGKPWIYFVRQTNEITEALITSIEDIFNKFTDDDVKLEYAKSSMADGIVDCKIKGKILFRIVSLSIQMRRIKLAVLANIGGVLMDEYIIDPNTNEKYQKNEAFKIKEAYTTWRREADGVLKMYFLGNPYSLYNPLFMWLGVPVQKLKPGAILVGDIYVIQCYQLTKELREYILKNNPLYEFDDAYKKYAFDGMAVNDSNIKISKCPPGYKLIFIFRHNGKYLGIYRNDYFIDQEDRFHCKFIEDFSERRSVYCFEFNELVNQCIIFSNEEKIRLQRFKVAMRRRQITFEDINSYYIAQEIYNMI